jgi:hypothetical protein
MQPLQLQKAHQPLAMGLECSLTGAAPAGVATSSSTSSSSTGVLTVSSSALVGSLTQLQAAVAADAAPW